MINNNLLSERQYEGMVTLFYYNKETEDEKVTIHKDSLCILQND